MAVQGAADEALPGMREVCLHACMHAYIHATGGVDATLPAAEPALAVRVQGRRQHLVKCVDAPAAAVRGHRLRALSERDKTLLQCAPRGTLRRLGRLSLRTVMPERSMAAQGAREEAANEGKSSAACMQRAQPMQLCQRLNVTAS